YVLKKPYKALWRCINSTLLNIVQRYGTSCVPLQGPNSKRCDELISSEEIQNEIEIEQQTDNLVKKFWLNELYKDNSNDDDVSKEGIMDLTHKSHFVRQLPEDFIKVFLNH
ncbi:16426_t:CDS:2, partial [Funneliformis mosseae]